MADFMKVDMSRLGRLKADLWIRHGRAVSADGYLQQAMAASA
ncbi:MAG: hypothetical protein ACLSAH_00905 [Bilophila wadsworthia]